MTVTVHTGDCLDVMRALADNSVDSVVTDPPYGIRFMGKAWDGADIERRHASADSSDAGRTRNGKAAAAGMYDLAPEAMKAFQRFSEAWAAEALRILKPGGILLSFASPRTYHRMASGIEDAGFEIRDQIMWMFGSGFPKSHNGAWGGTALKPAHEPVVVARKPLIGTVAANFNAFGTGALNIDACRIHTAEALRAGAGRIPCRHDEAIPRARAGEESTARDCDDRESTSFAETPGPRGGVAAGRWPANLIHDGSDDVLSTFPTAPGQLSRAKNDGEPAGNQVFGKLRNVTSNPAPRGDVGSAARFFYCAKASKKDREAGLDGFEKVAAGMVSNTSGQHITRRDDGYEIPKRANTHPTVKPTELMRYLCRLVTPVGGIVLDPFMGSGSTGRGAVLEGLEFVGIELDADYVAMAAARIADAQRMHASDKADRTAAESQIPLFAKEATA